MSQQKSIQKSPLQKDNKIPGLNKSFSKTDQIKIKEMDIEAANFKQLQTQNSNYLKAPQLMINGQQLELQDLSDKDDSFAEELKVNQSMQILGTSKNQTSRIKSSMNTIQKYPQLASNKKSSDQLKDQDFQSTINQKNSQQLLQNENEDQTTKSRNQGQNSLKAAQTSAAFLKGKIGASTPAAKSMRTFGEFSKVGSALKKSKNQLDKSQLGFDSDNQDLTTSYLKGRGHKQGNKSIIPQDLNQSIDSSMAFKGMGAKKPSIFTSSAQNTRKNQKDSRPSSRDGGNQNFDQTLSNLQADQLKAKNTTLIKSRILKQIDENLAQVGLESESQSIARDQLTMSMFKMGYIKSFQKEESLACTRLCNISENPDTKEIKLRDFKILILAINKIFFDWMTLSNVNIDESKKYQKDFGFFYQDKYYINSKDEVKAINQTFITLFENKKLHDLQLTSKQQKDQIKSSQKKPAIQDIKRDSKMVDKKPNVSMTTRGSLKQQADLNTSINQKPQRQAHNRLSAVAAQSLKSKIGQANVSRPQSSLLNSCQIGIKNQSQVDNSKLPIKQRNSIFGSLNPGMKSNLSQTQQLKKPFLKKGDSQTKRIYQTQQKDNNYLSEFDQIDLDQSMNNLLTPDQNETLKFYSDTEDYEHIEDEEVLKEKELGLKRQQLLLEQQKIKLQLQKLGQHPNKANQKAKQNINSQSKHQNNILTSGYMTQQDTPHQQLQTKVVINDNTSSQGGGKGGNGSVRSYKTLDFLNKENDYDEVDIKNTVVYEVEEKSDGKFHSLFQVMLLLESEYSEYDSEAEEVSQDETVPATDPNAPVPIIELEINLDDGQKAKLLIFNEEKFEDDIQEFCLKHKLEDIKRKKLQKLVKEQLVEMFEEENASNANDKEDSLDQKNMWLLDELNKEIEQANAKEKINQK
eukprot:403341076